MACWRTKAAISLKCVKIAVKLLWTHRTAYSNSPTLFRTVPSWTPCGLPFPKIGVCNPHQKLQSKIAGKRVHIEWNSLYGRHIGFFGGIESVDIARDHPNFWVSLLTQEQVKLQTSYLAVTFRGCIRSKPFKSFGEKGAWVYTGTAEIKFFGTPYHLRNG